MRKLKVLSVSLLTIFAIVAFCSDNVLLGIILMVPAIIVARSEKPVTAEGDTSKKTEEENSPKNEKDGEVKLPKIPKNAKQVIKSIYLKHGLDEEGNPPKFVYPQYESIERCVLETAIKTGNTIKVIYHSGNQCGTAREIIPLEINEGYVNARCIKTNKEKTYSISKIELAKQDYEVNYDTKEKRVTNIDRITAANSEIISALQIKLQNITNGTERQNQFAENIRNRVIVEFIKHGDSIERRKFINEIDYRIWIDAYNAANQDYFFAKSLICYDLLYEFIEDYLAACSNDKEDKYYSFIGKKYDYSYDEGKYYDNLYKRIRFKTTG